MAQPAGGNFVTQNQSLLIQHAEALAVLNEDVNYLKDGYVRIENGFITDVGTGEPPHSNADIVIDASDKLVMPGMINTHHHLYQTLTRAVPDVMDSGLFDWLKKLYPSWAGLDDDAISLSTQLGMAELMLSGCTTTTDHHYVFPQRALQGIDVQIEAAQQIGMRFHPTRGSMSLSVKDGGLPPDSVVQDEDTILSESERLIKQYHDPALDGMIKIALAPCSPFSVTRSLMDATAQLAKQHNVRLHTHLAETLDEEDFCLQVYGMRPTDMLEDVGWMNDNVWLAHGVHFDDGEISRLGQHGLSIAHCPSSNARLGSGLIPLKKLQDAGVNIGLGVDGSASNDASNMILELRQALFLQRVIHGAEAIQIADVIKMATTGSAACLGQHELGKIEVGKVADLALFDLNAMEYSGAHDPLGALVLCAPTRVHTLIVGGRVVVKDQELLTVDLDQLVQKHRRKAAELVNLTRA
jgi:8-oxoguanine deaminase